MLSGFTFSIAITFMSLSVAVTPEVNMAVKKAKVLMLQWSRMVGTHYTCSQPVNAACVHGWSEDALYFSPTANT